MTNNCTIIAFRPSNAEYVDDGYIWTLYNNGLENPYTVENTDEKINQAKELIDPTEYERKDHEHWVRLDFESIIDGNPERLEVPK